MSEAYRKSADKEDLMTMARQIARCLQTVGNTLLLVSVALVPLAVWLRGYNLFGPAKQGVFMMGASMGAGCAVLASLLRQQFLLPKTRLTLAVILYIGYTLASWLYFPYTDNVYVLLVACHGLFFLTISSVTGTHQRDRLLHALIVVAAISSIYGVFQFFGMDLIHFSNAPESRVVFGKRIYTTFGNPVFLAGFYAAVLPVIAAFALKYRQAQRLRMAWLFAGILAGTFLSLLMTQTRSAWLATGVSFGVFGALLWAGRLKHLWQQHVCKVVVAVLVVVIGAGAGITLLMKHTSLLDSEGLLLRFAYFHNTRTMILERPLFGRGPGTWNVYHPLYYDNRAIAARFDASRIEQRLLHAHNEYLEVLSDGGILGYALFLWIITETAAVFFRQNTLIVRGLATALVALLCDALFSPGLRFVQLSSVLWLLIAFANIPEKRSQVIRHSSVSVSPSRRWYAAVLVVSAIIVAGNAYIARTAYRWVKADEAMRQAMNYYNAAQYKQAIPWFHRVLSGAPHNKVALYFLANAHRVLQHDNYALNYYTQLTALDPNFGRVNLYLAELYDKKHEIDRMKSFLEQHIRVNNMDWKAYYNLAVTELAHNNTQQAVRYLQEIEAINRIQSIEPEYLRRVQDTLAGFQQIS